MKHHTQRILMQSNVHLHQYCYCFCISVVGTDSGPSISTLSVPQPLPLQTSKSYDNKIHRGPGLQSCRDSSGGYAGPSCDCTGLPASSEGLPHATGSHLQFVCATSGYVQEVFLLHRKFVTRCSFYCLCVEGKRERTDFRLFSLNKARICIEPINQ